MTYALLVTRASHKHLVSGFPQRVYRRFRDHAPISPGERTTPFEASNSSLIRSARLERSTSVAVVIFNFSITQETPDYICRKFTCRRVWASTDQCIHSHRRARQTCSQKH